MVLVCALARSRARGCPRPHAAIVALGRAVPARQPQVRRQCAGAAAARRARGLAEVLHAGGGALAGSAALVFDATARAAAVRVARVCARAARRRAASGAQLEERLALACRRGRWPRRPRARHEKRHRHRQRARAHGWAHCAPLHAARGALHEARVVW